MDALASVPPVKCPVRSAAARHIRAEPGYIRELMRPFDLQRERENPSLVLRLPRYLGSLLTLCWRRGVKAALHDVKARVRRALGIEQLEARLQALSQQTSPAASTWAVMSWIE